MKGKNTPCKGFITSAARWRHQLSCPSHLYTAIMKNEAFSAIALINAWPRVNFSHPLQGSLPHVACKHGLEEVASALFTNKANVLAQDIDGDDPLAIAVVSSHQQCGKVLLQHIPSDRLSVRNVDGDAPITLAANGGLHPGISTTGRTVRCPLLMILPEFEECGCLSFPLPGTCTDLRKQQPYDDLVQTPLHGGAPFNQLHHSYRCRQPVLFCVVVGGFFATCVACHAQWQFFAYDVQGFQGGASNSSGSCLFDLDQQSIVHIFPFASIQTFAHCYAVSTTVKQMINSNMRSNNCIVRRLLFVFLFRTRLLLPVCCINMSHVVGWNMFSFFENLWWDVFYVKRTLL